MESSYMLIFLSELPRTLRPAPHPISPDPARLSGWRPGLHFLDPRTPQMPVAVGPYGQSQPSCFDRVKMGFVMGCAVGMAAGALFGTFSCLR